MAVWTPTPEWQGQEAYLIGGGSSLASFDFSRLQGKNVIGCNAAFHLGKEIVPICIFGDSSWFHKQKWALEAYGGRVVTNAPGLEHLKAKWLFPMNRIRDGVHSGDTLGWNYSTGAAAINLAISLGARTIFLLGYDLGYSAAGKSHWHNYHTDKKPKEETYKRFIRGFQAVKADLDRKYPDASVWNVTDGSSLLPVFPRLSFLRFGEFLSRREQGQPIAIQQEAA